jgi:hypothetical protein
VNQAHSALAQKLDAAGFAQATVAQYPEIIAAIGDAHMPSRSPFFRRLPHLPAKAARDPAVLGQLHLVYQSAMHATRAAVYFLPHLDAPALRKRKLQIFVDDDGLPGGDTHHYQLTRAFRNIGAALVLDDEAYGDADELRPYLDAGTCHFVSLARTLYARSLGPWCIVELMSNDWMHALASGLAVHHPKIVEEPYFAECFAEGVEERHAEESLAVTQSVLEKRPELLAETIEDANAMAVALDGVWASMNRIIAAAS